MDESTKKVKFTRRSKLIALIVLAVLLSALGGMYFFIANDSPRLIVTTPSGILKSGEEFEVGVVLENNPGIILFCLFLHYDETRFDFVSSTTGPALDGQLLETKAGIFDGLSAVRATNGLRMKPFTNDGVLYTVKFKVKDSVGSGKGIFHISYREGDIVGEPRQPDNQPNNFAPKTVDGKVTV